MNIGLFAFYLTFLGNMLFSAPVARLDVNGIHGGTQNQAYLNH